MNTDIFDHPIVESIYNILRDSTRRHILAMLMEMKMTADDITQQLEISRPAVEKHLKQMLEIGLIERRAETYPTLHYIYSLPDVSESLIRSLQDTMDEYVTMLKEDYTNRLENEEQRYLLGMSSKERYVALKETYNAILDQLKNFEETNS